MGRKEEQGLEGPLGSLSPNGPFSCELIDDVSNFLVFLYLQHPMAGIRVFSIGYFLWGHFVHK